MRRLDAPARDLMRRSLGGLNTVCTEANCPNVAECWSRGTATFMIMGDTCTRRCRFCGVKTGRPEPLDPEEPTRLAEGIATLGLNYAVITCVDRDDLEDGGAAHWAACVGAVRERNPQIGIEALTGDFGGDPNSIATVVSAGPDVFAHNVEVVPRLQPLARPAATWERSLSVLTEARRAAELLGLELLTKTGLMLGIGETDEEAREALALIAARGVDLLTLGQYLKPRGGGGLLEVDRYVPPEQFDELAVYARDLGFKGVAASPLTRSSHLAETLFAQARGGS